MRLEDLKGRRIGRYEIIELLGRGGMAAVYRARDSVLRRDVALKILYPQYSGDVALIERFQREAVLAAGLDHPNILPIYDVAEDDGLVYIAMRLLSGRSLADMLRLRGALAPAELLPIVDQVAAALDYAHARQIVHRDIKPANILLEESGVGGWEVGSDPANSQLPPPNSHPRAVLTDFGIAKSLDASERGITATGVLIGTPEYMAPEQIRGGHSVDGRADVYALGVVVYRALTGRRPFEGSTEEVLMGHLHGSFPPPSAVVPGLPAALDAVLARALARSPAQRFQRAGELARALRSAAGIEPPTPPPALRRNADGRMVVPSVAVGAYTGDQAATIARTTDRAIPKAARLPTPPPPQSLPPQRIERGGGFAWLLLGLLLALVVGAGTLYAVGTLGAPPSAARPTQLPAPVAAPTPPPVRAPTAAPTSTAEPSPTTAPSPAATAAGAPTRAPTRTPQPSPTPTEPPTVTSLPTESPTPPPCPIGVGDEFALLIERQTALAERLGCAAQVRQERALAEQLFERGAMIWVAGPIDGSSTIYAIEGVPQRDQQSAWQSFEDTWRAGDPEDSGEQTPPEGLFEPIRGFGKLWYGAPAVAEALGWATAPERSSAGVTQRFANGRLIYSTRGPGGQPAIYVLFLNGSLEVYDGS